MAERFPVSRNRRGLSERVFLIGPRHELAQESLAVGNDKLDALTTGYRLQAIQATGYKLQAMQALDVDHLKQSWPYEQRELASASCLQPR